jgi:hypothetical protein
MWALVLVLLTGQALATFEGLMFSPAYDVLPADYAAMLSGMVRPVPKEIVQLAARAELDLPIPSTWPCRRLLDGMPKERLVPKGWYEEIADRPCAIPLMEAIISGAKSVVLPLLADSWLESDLTQRGYAVHAINDSHAIVVWERQKIRATDWCCHTPVFVPRDRAALGARLANQSRALYVIARTYEERDRIWKARPWLPNGHSAPVVHIRTACSVIARAYAEPGDSVNNLTLVMRPGFLFVKPLSILSGCGCAPPPEQLSNFDISHDVAIAIYAGQKSVETTIDLHRWTGTAKLDTIVAHWKNADYYVVVHESNETHATLSLDWGALLDSLHLVQPCPVSYGGT